MNFGQVPVAEMIIWIGASLLGVIAILLLILIGMVKKLINILQDLRTFRAAAPEERSLQSAAGEIPEEDLAAIMAVMVKMLPGVKLADIQIKSV